LSTPFAGRQKSTVAAEAFPGRAQTLLLAELANMRVREAALVIRTGHALPKAMHWSLCQHMKTGLYERSMTRFRSTEPKK
jgi:hypothetical protein